MSRYILGRSLAAAASAFVALSAMFLLLHASPASPINSLPPSVAADPAAKQAVLHEHGLDRPLADQYVSYVANAARGDLGTSLYDGSSVGDDVAAAAPVSLTLGGLAALVALLLGAGLALVSLRYRGRAGDAIARVLTIAGFSLPAYWLAVLCLVVVGERYPDLLPSAGGYVHFSADPAANLRSLLLPALVLGLGGAALVGRSLRVSLIEALDGDDVRFARAMGMSERQVATRIALRKAAPGAVTVTALMVGNLVAGSILVEGVFQLPGLGQLMITAFGRGDHPLALGAAAVTMLLYLLLNLGADLATCAIDPRVRRGLAASRMGRV